MILRHRLLLLALASLTVALPAHAVTRRAFVTSSAGTGNLTAWPGDLDDGLTGIAAANRICQNVAAASSLSLPNPQLYRAWISDSDTDAYCNVLGFDGEIADDCGQPSLPPPTIGPWRMANGATFFAGSLGDLLDGTPAIYLPLSRDENFDAVPDLESSEIWTGTSAHGTGQSSCAGWSSASSIELGTLGSAFATAQFWTSWRNNGECDVPRKLLCLEAGPGEPMVQAWSPASLVFVTSQVYSPDLGSNPEAAGQTGIAAGDAICRHHAAVAHLPAPDSFVAWLADGILEPATRITSNGPFKRIDAISVASSKADLLDGTINSSIHQDENGDYIDSAVSFLSGADANGHSTFDHCDGWTSSEVLAKGVGYAAFARDSIWADAGITFNCLYPDRLVCISNQITIFWDGFDATGDTGRWSSVVD